MYHIMICDDDTEFISYMKALLLEAGLQESEAVFYTFTSGEELEFKLPELAHCDLLIIDMQMRDLNGFKTAKIFRKKFLGAVLAFCSGVTGPTERTFKVTPYRYLKKTYSQKHMIAELKAILAKVKEEKSEPEITGNFNSERFRLCPEEVLYISRERGGCQIHVHPDKVGEGVPSSLSTEERLEDLYEVWKECGFAFPHNSYIINMCYIKKLSPGELSLKDGTKLSIARSKTKDLYKEFTVYSGKKY